MHSISTDIFKQKQSANGYLFIFQMQYSSFISDLQNYSYEALELPIQGNSSHFKRFDIKFRNKESREEAKTVLMGLEKDPKLLSLIPIAFNEKLEGELQTFSLFVEKEKTMPLIFEDVRLDIGYRIDLLVEKELVLEIKSVVALNDIHYAQTLNYMRLGNFPVGLLINFNVLRLKDGIKRLVNGY